MASIIIPTYYRNEYLQDAIESALSQEYSPTEVIVVDDSGEAHAEPVVDTYDAVQYIPLRRNRGENPARTVGVEAATGKYIQFLDDDDLLREDKLEKQIPLLNDSTGVVYSGVKISETGEIREPNPEIRGDVLEYALQFRMWPTCFTSAMVIDRSVLEEVLPLKYNGAGDETFMIGLARRTTFEFVKAPLVEKHVGHENLSSSMANVHNKKKLIFDEYEGLYDRFPDCRALALAHTYQYEGRLHLDERPWSAAAIRAFARAAYHAPLRKPGYAVAFLCSLGGQPGLRAFTLGRNFVRLKRKDGLADACREAVQYLWSLT